MKTWIAKWGVTTLTAAALLLPSASAFAGSSKLYVDDDKQQCATAQFSKVQDAINAAKPGDTVYVCPGTYTEKVTITKKLTLRGKEVKGQQLPLLTAVGAGGISNSDDAIVRVENTQDVTVRDLRITGDFAANPNQAVRGIVVSNAKKVSVEHNTISNCFFAIEFRAGSDKGEIRKNTLAASGSGINVEENSETKVSSNTMTFDPTKGFPFGVNVVKAQKAEVRENTITGAIEGIQISSSTAQVSSNTIKSPEIAGIVLAFASKSTVRNNTIKDSHDTGVVAFQTADNTIKDNTIRNSAKVDAKDDSKGSKTAGTANTWSDNTCATSDPKGLCEDD